MRSSLRENKGRLDRFPSDSSCTFLDLLEYLGDNRFFRRMGDRGRPGCVPCCGGRLVWETEKTSCSRRTYSAFRFEPDVLLQGKDGRSRADAADGEHHLRSGERSSQVIEGGNTCPTHGPARPEVQFRDFPAETRGKLTCSRPSPCFQRIDPEAGGRASIAVALQTPIWGPSSRMGIAVTDRWMDSGSRTEQQQSRPATDCHTCRERIRRGLKRHRETVWMCHRRAALGWRSTASANCRLRG